MSELQAKDLHAYHDGELWGLARWWFERRLRRSPELRRELAALGHLGELVQQEELRAAGPDLWDRISQRLPALDARRREAEVERGGVPSGLWRPLGAVAAAAVAILALWSAIQPTAPVAGGVVRWIDSGGRSVFVVDEAEAAVTIIWVLDEASDGATREGGGRDVA
jgi:anti-sigma-K factor RskA